MPRTVPIRPADRDDDRSSRLLAAAPLLDLLARWAAEVETLRLRAPNCEVLTTLDSARKELERSIDQAGKVALWLTLEQLTVLANKPTSTLSRECRTHGSKIGATKQHGSWRVFWPHYQKYLNNPSTLEDAA